MKDRVVEIPDALKRGGFFGGRFALPYLGTAPLMWMDLYFTQLLSDETEKAYEVRK
jgi:hypothetical protein